MLYVMDIGIYEAVRGANVRMLLYMAKAVRVSVLAQCCCFHLDPSVFDSVYRRRDC